MGAGALIGRRSCRSNWRGRGLGRSGFLPPPPEPGPEPLNGTGAPRTGSEPPERDRNPPSGTGTPRTGSESPDWGRNLPSGTGAPRTGPEPPNGTGAPNGIGTPRPGSEPPDWDRNPPSGTGTPRTGTGAPRTRSEPPNGIRTPERDWNPQNRDRSPRTGPEPSERDRNPKKGIGTPRTGPEPPEPGPELREWDPGPEIPGSELPDRHRQRHRDRLRPEHHRSRHRDPLSRLGAPQAAPGPEPAPPDWDRTHPTRTGSPRASAEPPGSEPRDRSPRDQNCRDPLPGTGPGGTPGSVQGSGPDTPRYRSQAGGAAPMPDEPGVAPGSPPSRPPPGTPPKGARPPPGSDSEQDSGFSDSGSEHLGRCEGTDPEEPPGPGHPHLGPACPGRDLPGPQPPGASRDPRPLLVLLPAPPSAAVPSPEGPLRCHPGPPGVPAELSPCPPRTSPCARLPLLAALALRTGALLRHNRRTQRDIATLRRHTRLLARATSDPRLWPRLWHLLAPAVATSGASGSHREPPAIGEGE